MPTAMTSTGATRVNMDTAAPDQAMNPRVHMRAVSTQIVGSKRQGRFRYRASKIRKMIRQRQEAGA